MFGDFARVYGLGRVAKSTRKTHAQGSRMWVSWRMMRGNGNWLGKGLGEWELVEERTEFMADCCAERKNKEATVAGKLMAVNVYHEQWGGAVSAAAVLRHSGSEERKQENACGGGDSGTGK